MFKVDINRRLLQACQYGDAQTVQELLQQGANPNAKDENGKPSIIIATECGHLKIITTLIQHGANPYLTDPFGKNALHHAVEKGHHDITEYLLSQLQINPNIKDRYGRTHFLIAAENGDIHMLQLLAQLGANPHTTDHQGRTALHYAVENQNYDIAQYLLTELKLDPNAQERRGYTPFLIAAARGDIPMLQLLAQHGANPHTTNHDGQNALHLAAEWQQYKTAQYLITQLKLDPNKKDQQGQTPLMIAAARGNIPMLQLLAQHGANPNATNHQGRTALHYAVEEWHHDIAQYLLTELKLNPNSQDQDGITPFLLATQNGDISMLQRLIQLGANPHIKNTAGKSALHYALENINPTIAQYLLTELKLDPNSKDQDGITPFILAAQNSDIDMIKYLIQHGANPYATDKDGQTALHHAAGKGRYETVQYLIIHLDLDPNTEDHDGTTPFMIAASKGDIPMLRLLIQLGANPYATDHQGRNALHYATKYRTPKTASFLITHLHLDPNQQDHNGNTPLLIAIERRHTFITQTLIQLGAHPHIPNHQGQTPSAIARRRIQLEKPQPSTITL